MLQRIFNMKSSPIPEHTILSPCFAPGVTSDLGPTSEKYVQGNLILLLDGDIAVEGQEQKRSCSGLPPAVEELFRRYRLGGDDFLRFVRGGFRLAFWDCDERKLVVAVDHFATKPVYYFERNESFAFAPRLSGLSSFRREIDPNVVYFYLNHSFVPAPFSIYRGIKRLEPGQYVVWDGAVVKVRQYWDIQYDEDKGLDEAAAANAVRSGVQSSVEFYLQNQRCDASEIGAFLSGGTDSSTLVGLLASMQDKPIKTFSVGFDEAAYNEIHYARIAAKHFGADPHERFVSAEDALQAVSVLATSFDEPFGNSSAIPTYFCLQMAKETGIKAMFAGDGGDELFAGNTRYVAEKHFLPFDVLPDRLQALSFRTAGLLPQLYPLHKIRRYIERAREPNPARFYHYQLFLSQNSQEFFTKKFLTQLAKEFPLRPACAHYEKTKFAAALNRLLYMDLKMCIADNDLFKVNRMAELVGTKVCYPFLDRDLAEMTGKIPVALKLKGLQKRYIFKRAFRSLLPEEILKKKKHGFGLPIAGWLRTHTGFRDMARSLLLDSSSSQREIFQPNALMRLLREHDEERSDFYSTFVWNIMMLELWHRNHKARE